MSTSSALLELCTHRRAAFAARFLRPPGKFKRAELRDKPRNKIGEFENPVRKFVRLREKARQFSFIPPPRRIPIPKPVTKRFLQPVQGVPKVSAEALQRRLNFLLSEKSKMQQIAAKLRPGLTPFQAELFMWERQMRDLRKIYRAQYLQKLAEVTEEERFKQLQLYVQQRKDRQKRRQEIRQRIFEDKKRRAILKDRLRIEQRVTQSVQMMRQSRKKKCNIYWLAKLQKKSNFITEENMDEKLGEKTNQIFTRNISASDLLKHLGYANTPQKSIKKKIVGVDNVFRTIMENSFSILPEDECKYEEETSEYEGFGENEKAHHLYAKFSDDEKLKLLDEKLEIINKKIDLENTLKGHPKNLLLLQLKQQLEAAKIAFLEKKEVDKFKKQAMESFEGDNKQDENRKNQ